MNFRICLFSVLISFAGCSDSDNDQPKNTRIEFEQPQAVTIIGYSDHAMEPFMSRDGQYLFFNNLNQSPVNTNLHWCTYVNDTLFEYQGELQGVITPDLEGVPTMDADNNFYYVYTGAYEQTLSTIYTGTFDNGQISSPELVGNISLLQAGWVNFDVEVSEEGNTMYFVDGRFDVNGGPYEADFVIAKKITGAFKRASDSETILQNINTNDLEYAAGISPDELELYFTRVEAPLTVDSEPRIYVATRDDVSEPFSAGQLIEEITGFVEAPTVALNNHGIYCHKKEGNLNSLYFLKRKN